ncbi:hypothetical protein AB0J27_27130 [Micromonospora chokoriensis]
MRLPLGLNEPAPIVDRPFGEENRNRLLEEYFASQAAVTAENAWRHIYHLLMWLDSTTGLAHCYESDKCQPGRPWYVRTLAFHTWLAQALGATAMELDGQVDFLFKRATLDLARAAEARQQQYRLQAERQRAIYADDPVPTPGEDPELVEIVTNILRPWLKAEEPPAEAWQNLSRRVRAYVSQENKRKNLVGEGFEDTLAAILPRIDGVSEQYQVFVRPNLHHLPGFYPPREGDKTRQVDLALVRRSDRHRTLVTCKWSVRSDREEQFATDFTAYSRLESSRRQFDYVLVTNEFDPARLAAACEVMEGANLLFTAVVHVNPAGPLAAYDAPVQSTGRGIERARGHVASGRLEGVEDWLRRLSG